MRRSLALVPALCSLLALHAADAGLTTSGGAGGEGRPAGGQLGGGQAFGGGNARLAPRETGPGRPFQVSARQVTVQGRLDMDAVQSDNANDANATLSDHRGYGVIRAEMAVRVQADEKSTVVVGVGYRGEMGDYGPTNTVRGPTSGAPAGSANSQGATAAVTQAHVWLKDALGMETVAARAGRMPVSWYVREQAGAMLFDSRADDPAVRSWDGAQIGIEFDDFTLTPSAWKLPDTSLLYGAQADWKPTGTGSSPDDRTWFTLGIFENRGAVMRDRTKAQNLRSIHAGFETVRGGFELFGEGALQRGTLAGDQRFGGWGLRGGFENHIDGETRVAWGLSGGWLSGDRDRTDQRQTGFQDRWESVGDALIVENEQYGELSRSFDGNLQSIKGRLGLGFGRRNAIRLDLLAARFQLDKALGSSGRRDLGWEGDIRLSWDPSGFVTTTLFAGALFSGRAVPDALTSGQAAAGGTPLDNGRDNIYLLGGKLSVEF